MQLEPCEAANNNLQQIIAMRGRELSNLGMNATLNRNEEPAGNAHSLYDSRPPFSALGLPDSIVQLYVQAPYPLPRWFLSTNVSYLLLGSFIIIHGPLRSLAVGL